MSADGTHNDAVVLRVVFVVHSVGADGPSLQFRYVYQMTVIGAGHCVIRRYGHIGAERHDGGLGRGVVKRRSLMVYAVHRAPAHLHGCERSVVRISVGHGSLHGLGDRNGCCDARGVVGLCLAVSVEGYCLRLFHLA